jgi:uncharacterized membrane protein YidH (DUF202 family)
MTSKLKLIASSGLLAALPFLAAAQGVLAPGGGAFGDLLTNILIFSNNVLIPFILGIGFLVFVWGMFRFFIAGGANDEEKEKGKSLMVYATLGFVLIIVFWGIVNLLATSTGLDGESLEAGDLNLPVAIPPRA